MRDVPDISHGQKYFATLLLRWESFRRGHRAFFVAIRELADKKGLDDKFLKNRRNNNYLFCTQS